VCPSLSLNVLRRWQATGSRKTLSHCLLFGDVQFTTLAIGKSHPEFLTTCPDGQRSEPLNVMEPVVHAFVHDLYAEVAELFPDPWMHIGGDEGASVEF
jgi:hypothetical protein